MSSISRFFAERTIRMLCPPHQLGTLTALVRVRVWVAHELALRHMKVVAIDALRGQLAGLVRSTMAFIATVDSR